MLIPGLSSLALPTLPPEEVIRLAAEAGLQSIEWNGAARVPSGKIGRAREIGRLTRGAGLIVSAYASGYHLGGKKDVPFEQMLLCATALNAPAIQVAVSVSGFAICSREERRKIVKEALRLAENAADAGLKMTLESCSGKLADTRASVRTLLQEMTHPNIDFLWQPTPGEILETTVGRLVDVLPRLRDVHVCHSWPTNQERLPLVDGEVRWRTYIDIVRMKGRTTHFLLAKVRNDSPRQLRDDAAVLRRFLDGQPSEAFR